MLSQCVSCSCCWSRDRRLRSRRCAFQLQMRLLRWVTFQLRRSTFATRHMLRPYLDSGPTPSVSRMDRPFAAERIHSRQSGGLATRFSASFGYGCARTGLRVTRHETFRLSLDEYDGLAEWVDAQMERGRAIATAPRATGDEWVCMDGSTLLTERIHDGHLTWMTGSCGDDHPSTLIEQRLIDQAFNRMGR